MKKGLFMLACTILMVQAVFADKKIYTTDTLQLPVTARQFIRTHFPEAGVSHIKIEKEFWKGNEYDVILTNGFDLDFDNDGQWKEVKGHQTAVPVSVLPLKIAAYLKRNFPTAAAVSIDKDRDGFEVKLTDGRELKFNTEQVFIRFDD